MRNTSARRGSGVLVLTLFAVFAACVLLVLTMGARSYSALVRRDEDAYHQRSANQYIAAKLRHADVEDGVSLGFFPDGTQCICLWQTIGGEEYVTRIYCHDGYLRELFSAAAVDLEPSDGQQVLPAEGLDMSLENGLLRASVTDGRGQLSQLLISLRSGREAEE